MLDPAQPDVLYASSERDLFITVDGGKRWRQVRGPPLSGCQALQQVAIVAGTGGAPSLFTTTRPLCPDETARVFRLAAGAAGSEQHWAEVDAGLPDVESIRLLVTDPPSPSLFAATPNGLWVADLPPPASGEQEPPENRLSPPDAEQPPSGTPPGDALPPLPQADGQIGTETDDTFLWAIPPLLLIIGLVAAILIQERHGRPGGTGLP